VNEVQQLSSFHCLAGVVITAYNQMIPARLKTVPWTPKDSKILGQKVNKPDWYQ
jgi:hypothetical protein